MFLVTVIWLILYWFCEDYKIAIKYCTIYWQHCQVFIPNDMFAILYAVIFLVFWCHICYIHLNFPEQSVTLFCAYHRKPHQVQAVVTPYKGQILSKQFLWCLVNNLMSWPVKFYFLTRSYQSEQLTFTQKFSVIVHIA